MAGVLRQPRWTRRRTLRRQGITLLEILISMGVLLVGLMGVAAMIPAGRMEVQQGISIDNANMVGRSAFRDMNIRGLLNPTGWNNPSLGFAYNPQGVPPPAPFFAGTRPTLAPAVVIDPLGLDRYQAQVFPASANDAILNLPRLFPAAVAPNMAHTMFDPAFRNANDLMLVPSKQSTMPPQQQMTGAGAKRASAGHFTWIATVVADPTSIVHYSKVTVSVAVFHKRNLAGPDAAQRAEMTTRVLAMPGQGASGGEVVIATPTVTPQGQSRPELLSAKPGQWVMMAGAVPQVNLPYFRWYRVISADVPTTTAPIGVSMAGTSPSGYMQSVTLAGPDWNPATMANGEHPTAMWLIDDVVAVYERMSKLELQ